MEVGQAEAVGAVVEAAGHQEVDSQGEAADFPVAVVVAPGNCCREQANRTLSLSYPIVISLLLPLFLSPNCKGPNSF